MPDTSKENVGGAKPRTVAAEVISARSPRGPRRHVSGKIMRLPVEVRQALDARLAAGSFGGYRALSRWLEETHNQFISSSLSPHSRTIAIACAVAIFTASRLCSK